MCSVFVRLASDLLKLALFDVVILVDDSVSLIKSASKRRDDAMADPCVRSSSGIDGL
jgi:hypothetical protein